MWKVNNFQAVMFTASSFMPLTYYFFARTAVEYSGYYSLWTIVCMVFVGLILAWLYQETNKCFPGMTGPDFYITVFGKMIGKLLAVLYLPLYIVFVAVSLHFYVMTLKPFLPSTPVGAINVAGIAVAALGAFRGLETLARASSIIAVMTAFGNVITMIILIVGGENRPHLIYALPPIMPILIGIYHLFPMYLGFNIISMLNPYIQKQWYPTWSVLVCSTMLIGNFVMCVSVLGYNAIAHLQYPFPYAIQLLRLSGFVVERLGITVVIVATAFTCMFASNHIWGLSVLSSRILGMADGKYRRMIIFMCVPVFLVATMLDEGLDNLILNSYLVPASWVALVILPAVVLIVAKLKKLPSDIKKYKLRYFDSESE